MHPPEYAGKFQEGEGIKLLWVCWVRMPSCSPTGFIERSDSANEV